MVCEVLPLDKSRSREFQGHPAGDHYVAQCEKLFAQRQGKVVDHMGEAVIVLVHNVGQTARATATEREGTGAGG
jgi:hypothetical protein